MTPGSSAIVTVAFGHSTEHLDYTFLSFAEKNPGVPLHAFIIGQELPKRRLDRITYHLVEPVPDFSHPLREIYFRRVELLDRLEVNYALVVDSYDVLCLQSLPAFEKILSSPWCRCIDTATLLNLGPVETEATFGNVVVLRDQREPLTAGARALIAKWTGRGNLLVATHGANIQALTGISPASGEIVVVRGGSGSTEPVGRLRLDEP